MVDKGLSERRALRVVSMSPSAYRYEPVSDRNCALKEKIIALAQRHRRYGAGMIYLKLRQAGELVRSEQAYRELHRLSFSHEFEGLGVLEFFHETDFDELFRL